jgi:hypothetical protein
MKRVPLCLFTILLCASTALGQRGEQPSPGVGNAVLLATNSIQLDRDTTIVSGDVIVNNATAGPILGEKALSLDRNVTTPAGFKIAATSIDLDSQAIVHGDAYYNTLVNQGTITGSLFTPLALPVYAILPAVLVRPPGSSDVAIADNGSLSLDEGAYRNLTVGKNATLLLTGGGYAFQSISVAKGGTVRYAAPSDLVVSGGAEFGANATIAPASGSGLSAASIRIQVDGTTSPSIHIGQSSTVSATLYATAASLVFEQSVVATGAFFARNIGVGSGGRFTVASAFNGAPTANSQTVVTSGTTPLLITLTGSDPEGAALSFSIVSGPTAGTLSAVTPTSPTSATVTYSPAAANTPDSFTFRVTDPGGASGTGSVTINSPFGDPPPNPVTVQATDTSAEVTKDVAATLVMQGTAPSGVALTFSIVSGSGPSHGSLGAVTQDTEVPERSATVSYTPDAGYVGPDAFQFQACGVIASVTVCDTALYAITVETTVPEPPTVAKDVSVSTLADTSVLISLGESSLANSRHFVAAPNAATLDAVEIAGNVADADFNGFGDNANALPGSVPVFMSAGVNQSGGAGSNGTVRMQFEWDLSTIVGSVDALQSAQVVLPTHRGTIDSLDTFFYWVGVSGDGNLTNSDFESPAEQIPGVFMPVPPSMPVNGVGTFSFSVLDQLRAAAHNGYTFFAIQGRVNESLAGPARGLEVNTTASGNVSGNDVPQLSLATPGISPPLTYKVTSLPINGTLTDEFNAAITTVPYDLPSPRVNYLPSSGFTGFDSFTFSATNGFTVTTANANIRVLLPNCVNSALGCFNGR